MASTTKGKLFYAEAVKGYTLKVMIDSLAMAMARTTFQATKKGFFHRNTDEAEHILFDVKFCRENFKPYRCHEEVTFSLNLKHLQKMVRNVKKKDSIIMFISKKRPDRLAVAIRPCGSSTGHNSRLETFFVTITRIKEDEQPRGLPDIYIDKHGKSIEVYGYPKVIDASDFQKMKKMTTVGKIVEVQMQQNNYISFYSDNGELYGTKLEFGEILDNPESEGECDHEDSDADQGDISDGEESDDGSESDNDEPEISRDNTEISTNCDDDSDDDEIKGWYEAEFHMSIFGLLMKLPGLCTQMQFYAPRVERYPLKIRMQAGTLGPVTVYIKDTIQIANEQTQREQRQAEEQATAKLTSRRTKK